MSGNAFVVSPGAGGAGACRWEWQVFGASVQGAAHRRTGTPNQDAAYAALSAGSAPAHRFGEADGGGIEPAPAVVVVVADGHGSPQCVRSGEGARLAAELFCDIGRRLLLSPGGSPTAPREVDRQDLAREVVRRWRQKVKEHHDENPLTEGEHRQLEGVRAGGGPARPGSPLGSVMSGSDNQPPPPASEGCLGPGRQEAEVWGWYGCTLVGLVVTQNWLMAVQLGDGDILVLRSDRTVERPIRRDEQLIANQTTSLSSVDAEKQVETIVVSWESDCPRLALISTDGYANSFVTPAAFEQVLGDVTDMLDAEGLAPTARQLPDWLRRATEEGSGDDISAVFVRQFQRGAPYPRRESAR